MQKACHSPDSQSWRPSKTTPATGAQTYWLSTDPRCAPQFQAVGSYYYRVACSQHIHPLISCKSLQIRELTMGSELRHCVARDSLLLHCFS